MNIKQDFKVYCSTNFKELNKSLVETAFAEDGALYIEGIASTTSIDEDGDYMTKSCLEDMKRQAVGLSVLKEHGRTLDDILGRVTQIVDSNEDNFKIKFKVLPRYEYYILELLENDINLGLSIGAKATDYEPNDASEYGWKINKAKLYEISLVPLPANWDSFGSVKISKEINDEEIVAKCFNGACKLLLSEQTKEIESAEILVKELEDAQKNDKEKYLTKKECINIINEASLEIYERLLSEVIDETKKMIEKYHLDTKSNDSTTESKETTSNNNENENSSKQKEDEEKEKSMKTDNKEDIDVEETPIQKDLEESERTSTEETVMEKEKTEVKEEVKKQIDEAEVTINVDTDGVSNTDVLKKMDEMQNFFMKKFDEELESKVDEKVEAMRKSIRAEVEEELFKELTTERQPVETEQPEVEKEVKEEEVEEEKNKAMSTHDIAKMLCP